MGDGRVIGLVSGKGGVGKTSLCVNLGIALREQGKEVTLIDADFSASNLGVYLGRYDHPHLVHQLTWHWQEERTHCTTTATM